MRLAGSVKRTCSSVPAGLYTPEAPREHTGRTHEGQHQIKRSERADTRPLTAAHIKICAHFYVTSLTEPFVAAVVQESSILLLPSANAAGAAATGSDAAAQRARRRPSGAEAHLLLWPLVAPRVLLRGWLVS